MSLLMDNVAATVAWAAPDFPLTSVFTDLNRRMRLCPRYLLDRHVVRAGIELALGRPTVFLQALRHLRLPYQRIWVEWAEQDRECLRQILETDYAPDPLKPIPDRLGFLVESDDGRHGTVTWAWQNPPLPGRPNPPNISPFDVRFDLGGCIPQEPGLLEGLRNASLGKLWQDNPVQLEALFDIWRTALHTPSAWGAGWLQSFGHADFFLGDIYGELIGVYAILLLLTTSRPLVEYRPVDRAKVNKGRIKKNVTPLLDHTEITLHLNHRIAQQQHRVSLGRKPPRIHNVAGYLARRGDKHWYTMPYIRGSGTTIERHIRVKA